MLSRTSWHAPFRRWRKERQFAHKCKELPFRQLDFTHCYNETRWTMSQMQIYSKLTIGIDSLPEHIPADNESPSKATYQMKLSQKDEACCYFENTLQLFILVVSGYKSIYFPTLRSPALFFQKYFPYLEDNSISGISAVLDIPGFLYSILDFSFWNGNVGPQKCRPYCIQY